MHFLCSNILTFLRAFLFFLQVPGTVLNVAVAPADENGQRAISISGTVGIDGRAGGSRENGGSSAAFPGTIILNLTTPVSLRVLVDRSSAESFIWTNARHNTIVA